MAESNKFQQTVQKLTKITNISETELFQNIVLMVEVGMDLKERCIVAEKHIGHLKLLFTQASRTIDMLQSTSRYSFQQAKRMLTASTLFTSNLDSHVRNEYEKLLEMIDRQLSDSDDLKSAEFDECVSGSYPTEKINFLESKQKISDNLPASHSSKSLKCDVDEKYPENWSRDSSVDLNTVVNLPPVPEDIFTAFCSTNRPKRSSSLSSLKSMRKIKLLLQRAETSDDEDNMSSDTEDHDSGQKGDSDDGSTPKKHLGNITEESQD